MGGQEGGQAGEGPRRRGREGDHTVAQFLGLGVQFCAAILVGVFAGQWADRRFGTEPWMILVGAFLGFGGGLWSMYRTVTGTGEQGTGKGDPGSGAP